MRMLGIEASRGFAALLVVTVHASRFLAGAGYGTLPFGGLFTFGHAGVDFFFVLSGFIIAYVHADDVGRSARLESYAWKRFIRIFPTYWVALALMGALLIVSPLPDHAERQLGTDVTSVLLLPWPREPLLGPAWSLRHELLFYLLFAVLFIHRRAGQLALGVWGLLTVWNVAHIWAAGRPLFDGLWGSFVFRIFNTEFFFGIAVAIAIRRGWIHWPRLAAILGVAIFVASGLYEDWGPQLGVEWPPRHLAYALGAALILYGLAGAEIRGQLKVPRPLVILGTASYSLYLVHIIFLLFFKQGVRLLRPHLDLGEDVWFVLAVSGSICAGLLFWRMVEQPLLRHFRSRRLKAAPAEALS